jgi:site-specific DNA-cytosine methylase
MNVLELFAGSRSIGKVAETLGYNVFSSDVNNFDKIDYVVDILEFDISKLPFKPDIIWASPPCASYSLAGCFHHRKPNQQISEFADKSDKMVKKTLEIINVMKPKYWFIENPRALLRKQKFMRGLPRTTVWYCKYGHKTAKITDIWSNNIYSLFNQNGWIPRPECYVGNKKCHHEPAPRGSNTGTIGLKNSYERSKIPPELCFEILKSCI